MVRAGEVGQRKGEGELMYEDEEWNARAEMFEDPGGNSALRRASKSNPRNLPCPTCGSPKRLTKADKARGYQCDDCADRSEGLV